MTTDNQKLSRQAVEAALQNRWQDALDLNLILLEQLPSDIPTLNRLAKSYEEVGEIKQAKNTYERVLKLDKYNHIAQNNLNRLKPQTNDVVTIKPQAKETSTTFSFIEEPGKTKTVSLSKLSTNQIITSIHHSQNVKLKANNRRISIVTKNDEYIGILPDDLALHLIKLIKLGNQYEAAVKNVSAGAIEVFIREVKKSARLKGLPSFPTKETKYYYQFLPTEPIAESPLELTDSEYSE